MDSRYSASLHGVEDDLINPSWRINTFCLRIRQRSPQTKRSEGESPKDYNRNNSKSLSSRAWHGISCELAEMLIVEDGSAYSEEIDFVELRCAMVPAYAGMTTLRRASLG